jgi:hypothetical protein
MKLGILQGAWLLGCLTVLGCGEQATPTTSSVTSEQTAGGGRTLILAETVQTPDVVDALFLGSGSLIPRDGQTACPSPGTWTGFPRGTTVRVRVSTAVSLGAQEAIRQAVAQVAPATAGVITAVFETTADPAPVPGPGQVTVTSVASPRAAGCSSDRGCIQQAFLGPGLLLGGRTVEPVGQLPSEYVRDAVGRGILGMCHIDARRIGGARNSLMSGGPGVRPGDSASSLTSLDAAATRAVYMSALNPGASRASFLSLGLVNRQAG